MADYNELMKLERKPKVSPPPKQPDNLSGLLVNQQTSKPENQQTSEEANQKTNKPVSKLSSEPAKKQTSTSASKQTTKQKKKYGTYLSEESISSIQMLAIQTKRKDHEVLQDIIDTFFKGIK